MHFRTRLLLRRHPRRLSQSAAFARRRLAPLKGWLAGALHQAAWGLEPDPQAVTGPGTRRVSTSRNRDNQRTLNT